MSDTKNAIESFNCCECGIYFGIDKSVADLWKTSHKTFVCPNGHSLSWKDLTANEKELAALRVEVEQLKKRLDDSMATIATQSKTMNLEEKFKEIEQRYSKNRTTGYDVRAGNYIFPASGEITLVKDYLYHGTIYDFPRQHQFTLIVGSAVDKEIHSLIAKEVKVLATEYHKSYDEVHGTRHSLYAVR